MSRYVSRRWLVVGFYKRPGDRRRRRVQTTVEATTCLRALTAHKAHVTRELRRYWIEVTATLIRESPIEVGVEATRRRG